MKKTNQEQTIRNIIIFTILASGLAWLGTFLGSDPTTSSTGFLVWETAPFMSALVIAFFGLLGPVLYVKRFRSGVGRYNEYKGM